MAKNKKKPEDVGRWWLLLFTVADFRSLIARKKAMKLGAIDFTSPHALIKALPLCDTLRELIFAQPHKKQINPHTHPFISCIIKQICLVTGTLSGHHFLIL